MSIILDTMNLASTDPMVVASLLAVVGASATWIVMRALGSLIGR